MAHRFLPPVAVPVLNFSARTTMKWRFAALFAAAVAAGPIVAVAQQPLPNTISTVAGGAGAAITGVALPASGAPCSPGSPFTATDAFGDGCPGMYAKLSADIRGGIAVDGQGNVFIMDTSNSLLRKVDARSGVVTAVTGTATTGCAAPSDSYGDGCPFAQTKLSTPRGVNIDPYGNVLVAGYGMQTINILCNAVSPLCPNTSGHKQLGSMYRIAGCVASAIATGTSGTGTTAGASSGDGYVASPYGDLTGDVSDWGAGSTGYGSCTAAATLGAVNSPRGVAADKYGNVYIAETGTTGNGYRYRVVVGPASFTLANGTTLINPMAGILALNPTYSALNPPAAYGKIYTILGGYTTTGSTVGAACPNGSGSTYLDVNGDGCPYYAGISGTGQQGVGTDAEGNVIFADNSKSIVRVLYVGTSVAQGATTTDAMANAIRLANGNTNLAVTQGYVYPIIAPITGSANLSATPTLGTATTLGNGITRVAVDASGNIYISDFNNNLVLFFDINTGYVRQLIKTGTACATRLDSVGDGCPANAASFSGSSSGLGIGIGPEGDLFLGDNLDSLIRKVSATNLVATAVNGTLTQTNIFHMPAGTTGMTAALVAASPDISVGTPTCPAANLDGTVDCTVNVTFAPLSPGQRSDALTVTATGSSAAGVYPMAANATGSALVTDVATPVTATIGNTFSASVLAIDGADNLYTYNFNGVVRYTGGVSTTVSAVTPTSGSQAAVDNQGNLYVASTGSRLYRYAPTATGGYASSSPIVTLPQSQAGATPATPAIYGVTTDRQGNVFVSDRTTESVYVIPAATFEGAIVPDMIQPTALVASGFTTVGDLSMDGLGNLFVADTGANKVYRVLAGTSTATALVSSVNPAHIAADAAGDLYVYDATAGKIVEFALSGATSNVYTVGSANRGLAVSGSGMVYEVESAVQGILGVQRAGVAYTFASTTATLPGTFTNVGNTPATGYAQTDPTEFPLTTGTTGGCGTVPSTANTLLSGAACTFTAGFNPGNNGQVVTSKTTLLPATTTVGSLTLTGTEPSGTTYTTTTTITGPASAVYAPTGTEITFSVGEVASNASSQNGESVNVAIDGGVSMPYTISAGAATVALSGLAAGVHTIAATYPGDGTYLSSTSSANFVITQASTTTTWTPAATSQQYSAAIGAGVLDATAKITGTSTTVPGYFLYTATPSGGSASTVHSASFLPIGTYSLGVTFVPTDNTDYANSTASVASYTVTKASTSAALGATQTMVATDGTGNYTSIQAAINAIPATGGGSIYVKPGTYTGDLSVFQPNVSIRGLGGDPTAVILTHASGAFSVVSPANNYSYAGEFTTAISNGAQLPSGSSLFAGDEGSATLVVDKGVNTAVSGGTLTPNNFYGENFTLQNTFNSDTATTTSTYLSSGACVANAGVAQTYNYLYNNNLQCASQALALWTRSDLAVFNNVYFGSLQDTIYTGSQGGSPYVPARQYYFRGKVTGNVDYVFGDSASVWDYTTFYTAQRSTDTIEAQNKMVQTGATGDYLSGYVFNSNIISSAAPGMSSLYFGRPYGKYSTALMLNSYVDQVNAAGWSEFSGQTNLPTSTYAEFNTQVYSDPAVGTADLNGVIYGPTPASAATGAYSATGGNTGTGVTGTRETTSLDPGTPEAANTLRTVLTAAQATLYYPNNFLSGTVSNSSTGVTNWTATSTLAAQVNAFATAGAVTTIAPGSSVTILMRPQTPGLGAVTNGVYTIPTGTYSLSDNGNVIASGTLDASGEAYFTASTLAGGSHSLVWTYGGDANFSGSTSSAYALTVAQIATTTALTPATQTVTYGNAVALTVTVTPASGSASSVTGNVQLFVDGSNTAAQTVALSGGVAGFSVSGLAVGNHTFTATYAGSTGYTGSSTTASAAVTISKGTTSTTLVNTSGGITYGQLLQLTATVAVASGAGTPTGNVALTMDGMTVVQTQPLSGTTASFSLSGVSAGSHTFTAAYAGDTNFSGSTSTSASASVAQAALTVTASGMNRQYNAANVLSFTVAGYVNGDTAATVFASGPTVSTTATRVSGPGSYPVTATSTLTTAGANNYTVSYVAGSFTITGGSPQTITFSPLPNFPQGGSYQLTAHASSGIAVTYTVTAGNGIASVNGATLMVTGTGPVTVQASTPTDPSGDYAQATPVSQSFTAQ